MGQADVTLRHLAHRYPHALARAVVPAGQPFAVRGFFDSQLTHIERRFDKALDISVSGDPRALHNEFQVDPDATLPYRVYEYQNLFVMAQKVEKPRQEPPKVESVVYVLRGPKHKPWSEEGQFAVGWPERPFNGTHYRVDPLYQRSVAELQARGSPFWLVFTPLARDASPAAMRDVIEEIRASVPAAEERAELFAAMLVMADLDPWGYDLRQEIEVMLESEKEDWSFMLGVSPTLRRAYNEGAESGKREGIQKGRKEGIKEGRKEGIKEGLKKGRVKGRLAEARSALRRVLTRRKLALTPADEERIEACKSLATLERWLDQAIEARSTADALR